MAGRDENRIFVGGLAWETTEKQLEDAFSRYGKIIESLVCFHFFFLRNYHLWNIGFCKIIVSIFCMFNLTHILLFVGGL